MTLAFAVLLDSPARMESYRTKQIRSTTFIIMELSKSSSGPSPQEVAGTRRVILFTIELTKRYLKSQI